MRMVGSCIVTMPRVITYRVVACASSRGLPDSCIASTFFQPDACRTVRNSETDLPERSAFRKLDPTIRKEPVAMKQLPVRGSCSGPLSLSKMLSGANAFEISDIERTNIGAHEPGI